MRNHTYKKFFLNWQLVGIGGGVYATHHILIHKSCEHRGQNFSHRTCAPLPVDKLGLYLELSQLRCPWAKSTEVLYHLLSKLGCSHECSHVEQTTCAAFVEASNTQAVTGPRTCLLVFESLGTSHADHRNSRRRRMVAQAQCSRLAKSLVTGRESRQGRR